MSERKTHEDLIDNDQTEEMLKAKAACRALFDLFHSPETPVAIREAIEAACRQLSAAYSDDDPYTFGKFKKFKGQLGSQFEVDRIVTPPEVQTIDYAPQAVLAQNLATALEGYINTAEVVADWDRPSYVREVLFATIMEFRRIYHEIGQHQSADYYSFIDAISEEKDNASIAGKGLDSPNITADEEAFLRRQIAQRYRELFADGQIAAASYYLNHMPFVGPW